MGFQATLSSCFAFAMLFLMNSSQGYRFYVGGRSGWVVNPYESYNRWAERMRFQVNDTLFFKFNKGNDSVLVVTSQNYNNCNTKNPIKSFTEGYSEFKFERSGPHFFISGNADHCKEGQKLIVVALAVRPKKSPLTPIPTPSPAPMLSPPSPSPAPSALEPAPASQSPASGPAPSPWAADSPAPSAENSFASPMFSSPVVGVVLSVAVGVGMILGSFNLLGGLN